MAHIYLQSITAMELRTQIAQEVRKELQQIVQPNQKDELLSSKESAKFFGVSIVTLHNWSKSGLIPKHKIGCKNFYKRSELIAALETINQKGGKR